MWLRQSVLLFGFLCALFVAFSVLTHNSRAPLALPAAAPPPAPPRLFPPLPRCPNFLIVTSEAGGVGHRMSSIAFALALAANSSAALVLDDALWAERRYGDSFDALRPLFSLHRFYAASELGFRFDKRNQDCTAYSFSAAAYDTPWGAARAAPFARAELALRGAAAGCGAVSLLPTGHKACTVDGRAEYCIQALGAGAPFARARPLLQQLFAQSPFARAPLPHFDGAPQQPREVVVAWHFRNGDITVGALASLRRTLDSVLALLTQRPARHLVVSQDHILRSDPLYGFIYSVPGFSFQQLSGLHFTSAFAHMAAADVLVHTGSSFAVTAAAAAADGQVFFFSSPHESRRLGDAGYTSYLLPHAVPLQLDGGLLPEDAGRAAARLGARLQQLPHAPRCAAAPHAVSACMVSRARRCGVQRDEPGVAYDLSPLSGEVGFVAHKEEGGAEMTPWAFTAYVCADGPPPPGCTATLHDDGTRDANGGWGPAFQSCSGPSCHGGAFCKRLGANASGARVEALADDGGARGPARGVEIKYAGGSVCRLPGGVEVARSLRLVFECEEGGAFNPAAATVTEAPPCTYTLVTRSRFGCPLQCVQRAGGAVCSGAGDCAYDRRLARARCACRSGFSGEFCERAPPRG